MGQYYYPSNLDKKENVCAHDYSNGLKLMEHSYIKNEFMMVIENLLSPKGKWYKNRIVWAGDYADPEIKDLSDTTIYALFTKTIKPIFIKINLRYIINHDKKEFIDKNKIKEFQKGWKIHPLSLLTCEGNGRGGGDFCGEDKRIGMWARNRISINNIKPKNYSEIDGTFIEEK